MKSNHKNIILISFSLFFVAGCSTWSKTGGGYVNEAAKYKVELPWGWMKFGNKDLMLTRDGFLLEKIAIERKDINKKLEHTKKKFMKGMLPEELAEITIDDITTDPDIANFEIIENFPVSISGQQGFRLIYNFSNKDGLKYKRVCYGFSYENWFYTLSYAATADYYFDKNFQEFVGVLKSFKFLPVKTQGETTLLSLADTKKQELKQKEIVAVKEEITQEPKEPEAPTAESPKEVIQTSAVSTVENAVKINNYSEYYRFLYKTISGAVRKPEGSPSGTINVSLTLSADGTMDSFEILPGSSEDVSLRSTVEKAIKDSLPFPPFPDDIKAEGKKTFIVTIEFRLR